MKIITIIITIAASVALISCIVKINQGSIDTKEKKASALSIGGKADPKPTKEEK